MTAFAGDAGHETVFVVDVGMRIGGKRVYVRCVTLKATRVYRALEVGGAILVAGTVDPLFSFRPVAYGKLIQRVAGPV